MNINTVLKVELMGVMNKFEIYFPTEETSLLNITDLSNFLNRVISDNVVIKEGENISIVYSLNNR